MSNMSLNIDRTTQVVDCRCGLSHGVGGSLARAGTLSQAGISDVIVVAMGSGRRHITKPVCEITYAIRKHNIHTSVLVLYAGTGYPGSGLMGSFGINENEINQINKHNLAVIHFGNVKNHFLKKAQEIFNVINIPSIIICQALVDFEDFAEVGINTKIIKPNENSISTKGMIIDIVTGITRGESCSQLKLNEIITKIQKGLNR